MKVLYLVSEREYSGTSAVVIGLALKFRKRLSVGYIKPLGFLPKKVGDRFVDADAHFMWDLLDRKEPEDAVCPILLTPQIYEAAIAGRKENLTQKVLNAVAIISAGKDLILAEGAWNARQGKFLSLSSGEVAQILDAAVILVERFDESDLLDRIMTAKERFGKRLAGVILNLVPDNKLETAKKDIGRYLKEREIPLFGVIPFLTILSSTSVEQLASHLGGRLLCAKGAAGALIESVMVGAMSQEHCLLYFRRKKNFAVVTGGDRSDIHVAAIDSGAKCLILTGGFEPDAVILSKAEEANVPIILVNTDTFSAAEKAEWIVAHARAHEPEKLAKLEEALTACIDFPAISRLAGVK